MVKYTMTAVVPVAQYANLQPSVEVEADTIEEAEAKVMPYIEDFYNKYSEKSKIGSAKRAEDTGRALVKDIFGNEIFYNDKTHEYTNSLGEIYISGSKFYDQFEKPFNADMISNIMVRKNGLPAEASEKIKNMWSLKSEASTSFGTAIHAALQLYGQYKNLSESVGKETNLHDNPIIKDLVEKFYEKFPQTDDIKYESLVVDHKKKRAGRIDRIEKIKGKYYITDFKTNAVLDKKSFKKYTYQLNFYRDVCEANGMTISGMYIYHYSDGEWKKIVIKRIDIDELKHS